MLSAISVIITILNGLVNLFKGVFGKSSGGDQTEDAATKAVAMSNQAGHVAAEVSRDTESQLNQGLQNENSANASDVDRVRNAVSVRDQQSAVDDAIASANQDPDPDH